jgi:hypothetical protein
MPLLLIMSTGELLVSNPVKDVGGGVYLDGSTRCHENETEDTEQKRNSQSLESSEYVKNFSEGGFHDSRGDIGNDSNDRDKRM